MYSYFKTAVVVADPILVTYRYDLLDFEAEVRSQDVIEAGAKIAIRHVPAQLVVVNVGKQLATGSRGLVQALEKEEGAFIRSGERVAQRKGLLGLVKRQAISPVAGTYKSTLTDDGVIVLRAIEQPQPVTAYLPARVLAVDAKGITVETYGRLVQGMAGIGGTAFGVVRVLSTAQQAQAVGGQLPAAADPTAVLVCQSPIDAGFVGQMAEAGVRTVVAPAMPYDSYEQLRRNAGGVTVVLTEGFGTTGSGPSMAAPAWELLSGNQGEAIGLDARTDVSTGSRPFMVLPVRRTGGDPMEAQPIAGPREHFPQINAGQHVRCVADLQVRSGRIVGLWPEPRMLPSGYRAEAVEVVLDAADAPGAPAPSPYVVPTDDVEVLVD